MKKLFFPILMISLTCCTSCKMDDSGSTVTDYDGNTYNTVKIGGQVWMAENLRVVHFNNGDSIPLIIKDSDWEDAKKAAFCWYDNDPDKYDKEYGVLYNFHAIKEKNLCPKGWHLPDEDDFYTLVSHLDPKSEKIKYETSKIAGAMLKSSNDDHWFGQENSHNKETGFSALPGGCRSFQGKFSMIEESAYFGGLNENSTLTLFSSTSSAYIRKGTSDYVGVSVRCIKD